MGLAIHWRLQLTTHDLASLASHMPGNEMKNRHTNTLIPVLACLIPIPPPDTICRYKEPEVIVLLVPFLHAWLRVFCCTLIPIALAISIRW